MVRRDLFRLAGLLGLASLLPAAGCSAAGSGLVLGSAPRRSPQPGRPSVLTPFATRLLDALVAADADAVVSPFSIAAVLAMVGNGAKGTSLTQLETALGAPLATLNEEFNATLLALAKPDADVAVVAANALWAQRGYPWQQAYLDALAGWYGAGVREIDFAGSPASGVAAINAWAKERTRGLIPEIVNEPMINRDTRLCLGNAVYFKGRWQKPFLAELTTRGPFTLPSGERIDADLMHGRPWGVWTQTPAFASVAIPFESPDYAMVCLLPARGLAPLGTLLGGRTLGSLATGTPEPVSLTMPKWTFRLNRQLKGPLGTLGIVELFDPGRADLSGMTTAERLFLSFVVHEAVIKVDEAGAEAAAVTVAGAEVASAPLQPRELVLDRPFYWTIVHVPSQTPLFLGRVVKPAA